MIKSSLGYILIILGAIIAFIATIADLIGLGDQPGIGWQQLLLLILGIYISIFGLWRISNK